MLIRREQYSDGCILGIWKIAETVEQLLSLFPDGLKKRAERHIGRIRSEKRAAEWLSVRLMLFLLLEDEKIVRHLNDGRPYLTDGSYNISISHTKCYAAILLNKTKVVGIDIEEISDRVHRVSSKFISEDEYVYEPLSKVHMLLHWSAKETMFKMMEEREIDFKQHLHLTKFIPEEKGIIDAHETKTDHQTRFSIRYEVHPEYVLTWATQ